MTVFDFQPSQQAPFQFQPTLDGQTYTAIITWNLFARRYYLNLYSLDGTLIVSTALVGSPPSTILQSMSWDKGIVTASVITPYSYRIGSLIDLTITGVIPAAYNGRYPCRINSRSEFEYDLSANPGGVTQQGFVAYNINLVAGYFSSSLVYRQSSRQFEVTP